MANYHWRIVQNISCFPEFHRLPLPSVRQISPSLPLILSWGDSSSLPPNPTDHGKLRCHILGLLLFAADVLDFERRYILLRCFYLQHLKAALCLQKRLLQFCLLRVPLDHLRKQVNSPLYEGSRDKAQGEMMSL